MLSASQPIVSFYPSAEADPSLGGARVPEPRFFEARRPHLRTV
jgi:hypothetical protein